MLGSTPRASDSGGLGREGPQMCISARFPGASAVAAGGQRPHFEKHWSRLRKETWETQGLFPARTLDHGSMASWP